MSRKPDGEERLTENIRGKCTPKFRKRVDDYLLEHEDVTEAILVRKSVREFLDREDAAVKGPHAVASKRVRHRSKL